MYPRACFDALGITSPKTLHSLERRWHLRTMGCRLLNDSPGDVMEYEDTWTLFRLQSMQPSRFEELCVALLEAEGHSEVEHWGAAGREGGVDIRSMDAAGKWWITQCKRTTSFPPSQAVPEFRKVLKRPPSPLPDYYRLAAPCKISRETTEALVKEAGSRLEIRAAWSATTLVGFLRDQYPGLHQEFIGQAGPLPFWNVPRRTDFFTGREDVLEKLEQRLEASRSAALTQTIVGLGGIGKTQTAIEYCLRHRARYHAGTFWVDASSADSLQASYAECARGLGLVDEQVPDDKATAAFGAHLQRHSGWLVVLDNADNPDAIRSLLPPNSHGHVLITTRDQAPRLGRGEPIRLDSLPIERATDFLLERTRRSEDFRADAEALATALEGLPLALEQAGAYLAEFSTLPLRDYLEKFESLSLDYLEGHEPIEGDYGKKTGHRTIAATWEISFRALEESAPAAAEALNACAFLDPQAIPLKIFSEGAAHLGPSLKALAESLKVDSTTVHTEILRPLRRYSFVGWSPDLGKEDGLGSLSVHRLVQTVARWRLRDRYSRVLTGLYRALDELFPRDYKSPSTWINAILFLPHVQASANYWSEDHGTYFTTLWSYAGNSAFASGRVTQAYTLHKKALEVRRDILGERDPGTIATMSNLASAMSALGKFIDAMELQEKALDIHRSLFGEEHPDTLTLTNNFAEIIKNLGDLARAKQIYEENLKTRLRVLGDEHPDTFQSMNNLAEALRALGDTVGAKRMHKKALSVSRRVHGEEHPDTLTSMHNLAETLSSLGETTESKALHEETLKIRRHVLGEGHPDTLTSMHNLAETLRVLGEIINAKELHQEALTLRQRILGEEHPDTLFSMNSIALTLKTLGNISVAKEIHERTLEMRRRILGEEHPDTLISMHNLAITLRDLEKIEKARALFIEVVSISRRVLGEDHPQTKSFLANSQEFEKFHPRNS